MQRGRLQGRLQGRLTGGLAVIGMFLGVAAGPLVAQDAPTVRPGEMDAPVAAIAGVIAGDARWDLVWAGADTADGIVGHPDGALLFAQEQTGTVRKLAADGTEYVFLAETRGVGALSMDAEGRLYGVERTCTDPGLKRPCAELTRVSMLHPSRRVLANSLPDGRTLGRLNDLIADGRGGVFFTTVAGGAAYHVGPDGAVKTVAEDADTWTNGVMLSPDGRTLYLTNRREILAFRVHRDGSSENRRRFAMLDEGDSGDGMAIDAEGRLYVTDLADGIHVFTAEGKKLGEIPTPRRPISVAFAGPDKRTLYVAALGAVGLDGRPYETPEDVRNTAMSVYRIPMLAEGFAGRPK